jgi:predicted nuclease of predicted toxin-antitoxin system
VRFLVDENLSPRLCPFLVSAGDSAEHVRDAIGSGAGDDAVMQSAAGTGAVIVTADTDFGTLLARSGRSGPSVILVRELLSLAVEDQGRLIAANLDQIRPALTTGAIVVLTLSDIRVRPLPIA